MIDAKEARKKTLLNSKLKTLMADIEKGIEDATNHIADVLYDFPVMVMEEDMIMLGRSLEKNIVSASRSEQNLRIVCFWKLRIPVKIWCLWTKRDIRFPTRRITELVQEVY